MKIIPFEPGHLKLIIPQKSQVADMLSGDMASDEYGKSLAKAGPAVTGIHDGEVVFILGKSEQWKGRHIVWSMMSDKANKHMLAIVRAIKRVVPMFKGDGRIEVIVRADFKEGCKLVERFFDFKFHHYEERFLPDGSDAKIYVRYL